ncbi:MAG: phospho-N-acetylmuramoyl-pentapeptide-transferase [Candidatus Aceula meridiana]|nr:phospho-N-acetylmuramoyl-pentapeptide-transferase [Candidatus Aceula meridiana]
MFYYLSTLSEFFPQLNLFRYITFRAAAASVTSFFLCMILGPIIIAKLKERKICDDNERDHCDNLSKLHLSKKETPTMGGVFIISSILISVALWANLTNFYIILTIVTCLWLFVLGLIDDTLKLKQSAHRGLNAWTKLSWQVLLGLVIGYFVFAYPNFSTRLDIPFFKNLIFHLGAFYIIFAAIIIAGSSNAVNFTDGLDGLAVGCVLIVAFGLSILSYISGHMQFAEYLFLPYISGAGELTVFCAAIFGAGLGFLWFNCYPASIFMGDVGSLPLGGTLGVIAIFIKKEFLLVLLGGVFVWEVLSVILQVGSFKLRGKRIFKCAPFHHHLQLIGWEESKVTIRLWIIAIILALLTLATLKVR